MNEQQQAKLTYIQQRILQLRTFLTSGNPVSSITVDGITVSYDRNSALRELEMLEKQEKAILSPRAWIKSIDLS
jgi:hypothetical protein